MPLMPVSSWNIHTQCRTGNLFRSRFPTKLINDTLGTRWKSYLIYFSFCGTRINKTCLPFSVSFNFSTVSTEWHKYVIAVKKQRHVRTISFMTRVRCPSICNSFNSGTAPEFILIPSSPLLICRSRPKWLWKSRKQFRC